MSIITSKFKLDETFFVSLLDNGQKIVARVNDHYLYRVEENDRILDIPDMDFALLNDFETKTICKDFSSFDKMLAAAGLE